MVVLVKGRRKALTFEGKECPKGHTIRYVSTRNCVECVNKANDKWYAENTNSRRKAIHRWMSKEENKDKMRVTARRHARYNRGWAEGEPERAEGSAGFQHVLLPDGSSGGRLDGGRAGGRR
jgi:hypothetical protein